MVTKITIGNILAAKQQNKKIAAVSCYDCLTAKFAEQAGIEMIIVGDSAAQVVLGYDSTLPATMDFMAAITAGVRRGAQNAFVVADMPFLSYQADINEAVKNAGRFVAEAGASMVKIEATRAYLDVIKRVSEAGIAVMAHIGIRPQSINKLGKLRAEGTNAQMAADLVSLAKEMVYAGASMLLLEGVAQEAAGIITKSVNVPVIGCGSGAECDGQVLIAPDILGLTQGVTPKFAKSYTNLAEGIQNAFMEYAKEIKEGKFPDSEHSYHMKAGELDCLKRLL